MFRKKLQLLNVLTFVFISNKPFPETYIAYIINKTKEQYMFIYVIQHIYTYAVISRRFPVASFSVFLQNTSEIFIQAFCSCTANLLSNAVMSHLLLLLLNSNCDSQSACGRVPGLYLCVTWFST